jgi:uncharacterized OB-fold protein
VARRHEREGGAVSEVRAVKDGLFHPGTDGSARLLGGYCTSCGRRHFPRAATCPYCSTAGCTEEPLGSAASLWLYTTVINRPPGYRGEVPFGFGVVTLPEGLHVVTLLTETDPGRLRPGQEGRLVVWPLHRDDEGREVVTYAFAPEGA